MTAPGSPQDQPSARSAAGATPPVGAWWPWAWMVLATGLLVASGVARDAQDRRFRTSQQHAPELRFPLSGLPKALGRWRSLEGKEAVLDPRIARIAGSSESLIRDYVDDSTGVVVTLLIVYGKAEVVTGHTPEACYPAVGYEVAAEALDVAIPVGARPARFRTTVFARKEAAEAGSGGEEVYHSFLHNGHWSPDVAGNWKVLRYSAPVHKVQVRRRVADGESRQLNNPTESFLSALIPEIGRRVGPARDSAAD
jgi:hypothetical protein